MKADYLNTQSKQFNWSYNHWNNINKDKDFIEISLPIYQMVTILKLNRRSLSVQ